MKKSHQQRQLSLQLLRRTLVELDAADKVMAQTGKARRLSSDVVAFLRQVCTEALNGEVNPLGVEKPRGRTPDADGRRAIARAVEDALHAAPDASLEVAREKAAEALGYGGKGLDKSGEGGVFDKAHQAYGDQIRAAREFYRARNAGEAPPPDAIEQILGQKSKK